MNIQKQIKQDLSAAIKAKDPQKKDTLRVIMGEFGRLDKKELSDHEAIKIMIKLMKSEKELLEIKGDETDSEFIRIIENYSICRKEHLKKRLSDGLNRISIFPNLKTKCKP